MKKFFAGFNILKEIYPTRLLLLVYSPIVIGFVINYELFDSRYIVINLIWIPFFTIPYILLRKKIVYQMVILIYFFIGLIEISHWIIIKGPLTLTSILVISNTNFQEVLEFLNIKAAFELLILLPYTLLFFFSFRHPPQNYKNKINPFLVGAIILVSFIFIIENAINGRLIRKGTPQIIKVVFSYITQRNLYIEAMQEISPRKISANSTFVCSRQIFVLIIGESCNRKHMSLYGALRKTNPKLEMRKDLILYNNVVSKYSNTLSSVLSMLSYSNLDQKMSYDKSIDIIDVFHSAGFKTYWLSNQSPIGIWDNFVTVLAKKSDYFRFVNTTSNSSFEAIYTTSYDSKLFNPFSLVLNEDVPKKFIVLHLMGSHTSYSKRYPADFDIFKGTNSKQEIIAEYDNSLLYNDFIVDSLLNIIISKDSFKNNVITSVIYLSDHGENVYDELDRIGHDYSGDMPKANVEIPFIVWLSPAYIKLNSLKATIIKSNTGKPFVTNDMFHSIMDFNGIKNQYLDEKKSIFNEKYYDKRQRILEDGKDYDRK